MRKCLIAWIALATIGIVSTESHAQCPAQEADTTTFDAAGIGALIPNPPDGLVFNAGVPSVELGKHSGNLANTLYALPDVNLFPFYQMHVAAVLDINNPPDGWDDIVTVNRNDRGLKIFRNQTFLQAAPVNWSTSGTVRTPDFLTTPAGSSATALNKTFNCSVAIVGGDFDNDGLEDAVTVGCGPNAGTNQIGEVHFHRNDGANSLLPHTVAHPTPTSLGYMDRSSSAMAATDWNGDGCLDILLATSLTQGNNPDNQILVLVNDCAATFTAITLLSGLDFAGIGAPTTNGGGSVVYADFDADGFLDIVATAATAGTGATDSLQLYLGDGAGGFGSKIALTGVADDQVFAQGLFAVDLDNDNMPDLAWTVDINSPVAGVRGHVAVWLNDNDGIGHPFEATTPNFTDSTIGDLDAGIVIDYDHDPHSTRDIFILNSLNPITIATSRFLVNRNDAAFADCGEVESTILSTALIGPAEFVITGAKLTITETQDGPGGTFNIRYFASNVDPPQWVEATECVGSTNSYPGLQTNNYCVRFPAGAGTTLRWKAILCGDGSGTPDLRDVDVNFDYVPSALQLRAGVVTSNGVGYVGGFASPGDRGKFSAFSIDPTNPATFWEAHTELDTGNPLVTDRKIYTADRSTGGVRIDFVDTGNAPGPGTLVETLNVATGALADALVAWWHNPRFGAVAPLSRLGAIVNSTAAVVPPPGLPVHYSFLASAEQTVVDAFIDGLKTREELVLFGSKDGAIHAFETDPAQLALTPTSGPTNGREQWAFIPAPIAKELHRDKNNGTGQNLLAFPDGPPSVADVYHPDLISPGVGGYITVMVSSGGSGSTAAWALDITDTLDTIPGPDIDGPDPLWHKVIENAGNAYAKPAIIRVDDTSVEGRFQAVLATGVPDGPLPVDAGGAPPLTPHVKGRRVVAVDIISGAEVWHFDAICAVTSDITAFETDDNDAAIGGLAANPLRIDGFVDRVVFADYCGYVYMLNVATNPTGLLTGMGSVDTLVLDEAGLVTIKALFWTGTVGAPQTDPLGANLRRPIAGGIAARADDTTDVVLYFGTGGLDDFDPSKENMFYAVYARDGSIRSKFTPGCEVSGMCSKFFGGTVTTATQVIIAQSVEPVINNATCDLGFTNFILADLSDENANGLIDDNLSSIPSLSAASVGAIFASNNAIYITTLKGEVLQIGETSVTTPGSDTTQASSATDIIKGEYMATSGWRQVFY